MWMLLFFFDNTFYKDVSRLTPAQQQLHERLFPPATYHWADLKNDVLTALKSQYGNAAVTVGRKSIKVQTGAGRRASDVVAAVQFRRYATFVDQSNLTAHWGIQFFDASNDPIVNYPKYHIERGENKNQNPLTCGKFKSTVRIFKNFRNYLVDNAMLSEGIAPSYFLECLLYNVPNQFFGGRFDETVPAIISYLQNTGVSQFMCQNGVTALFGNNSTQWSLSSFETFTAALSAAWENWYA